MYRMSSLKVRITCDTNRIQLRCIKITVYDIEIMVTYFSNGSRGTVEAYLRQRRGTGT
jgi:exonuclease III